MSFAAMFAIGSQVFQGASSFLVGNRQKKMLKSQRNNQRKIIEAEYNYNKGQLEKEFINSSMINFENISSEMNKATTQILSNLSSYNLNTIDTGGGTSYNSAKTGLVNSVENDYQVMIRQLISDRNYNEYALIKNMNDSMYQLQLNRNKQLYGIDTAYSQYKNAINDKMFSNIFQAGANIFGTVQDSGGWANALSKGKNDTTIGNFLSNSLGFGGAN